MRWAEYLNGALDNRKVNQLGKKKKDICMRRGGKKKSGWKEKELCQQQTWRRIQQYVVNNAGPTDPKRLYLRNQQTKAYREKKKKKRSVEALTFL